MTRSDHDRRIAEMFDRVAPRYDRLNRVLSAGRDIEWRRRGIALARLSAHQVALDVGTGTGDLAFGLLSASDASARVIAADISPAMLQALRVGDDDIARRRAAVLDERARIMQSVPALPLTVAPSQANFVFVDLGVDDVALAEALVRRGFLIRPGSEFGLAGTARITVGPKPLMERAAAALVEERAALLARAPVA